MQVNSRERVIISEEKEEKKTIKFCPQCGTVHLCYIQKCKCGYVFEDADEPPKESNGRTYYYGHYYYEDDYFDFYDFYDFMDYDPPREYEGMNCRDDDRWDYGNI